MEKKKQHKTMIILAALCAILAFAGCDEETDMSISKITIYNIPATIPVLESDIINDTYKIYLNASDYQEDDKPPKAQAMALISTGTLETNGTYTITMELRTPIINLKGSPDYNPDHNPNDDLGPWAGTARYFSLLISPKDKIPDSENIIWIVGSNNPLNKGKENCDWNSLIDFRYHIEHPESGMSDLLELPHKQKALYQDIVCNDPEIGP